MDWAGYLHFRPAFAEIADPKRYPIEWLDRQMAAGKVMFWRTDKAAIVAELKEYPTGACDVHGLIAAGDLDDITNTLIPEAEAWGRALGCIGAVIESRSGWVRALKDHGYQLHQTALRKELI